MVNEVHMKRAATMLIRDILARMRHDGCGGRAAKVELLTGIEGAKQPTSAADRVAGIACATLGHSSQAEIVTMTSSDQVPAPKSRDLAAWLAIARHSMQGCSTLNI